jgi:hypothetical protein
VMSTAESQLASACMQMLVPASIWSCGGDIVIPDRVVPGLDGISWGKTCICKGAPVVEDFRKFWIRGKYHFYSNHCGLLV